MRQPKVGHDSPIDCNVVNRVTAMSEVDAANPLPVWQDVNDRSDVLLEKWRQFVDRNERCFP